MAIPIWVSNGTVSAVEGPTDPTPGYPASLALGDLLLLHVAVGSTATLTTPADWILLHTDTVGTRRHWVLGKRATGAESGTLTVEVDNAATILGQAVIHKFTGWKDTGTLTDAFEGANSNTSTGTTDTHADCTTLGSDRLVCAFRFFGNSIASSVDAYSGGGDTWVHRFESGTTTANNGTIALTTADKAAAGTLTGGTDTITSALWGNRVFAIKPVELGGVTNFIATNRLGRGAGW